MVTWTLARCWKIFAAKTRGSSLMSFVSAISAFPHSRQVSRSQVKQLNRLVPLFWISDPFDQQDSSLQRKNTGPMLDGQIRRSSPHLSHGKLVRGISLSTSEKAISDHVTFEKCYFTSSLKGMKITRRVASCHLRLCRCFDQNWPMLRSWVKCLIHE